MDGGSLFSMSMAAADESQMVVAHSLKTNAINGLKGIIQSVFKASPIHFFSRMNAPLLQSILQKGLNAISRPNVELS